MSTSHLHKKTSGSSMTAIEIPCCLCGTMILPNSANQCGACLAQQFDLKVRKQYIYHYNYYHIIMYIYS